MLPEVVRPGEDAAVLHPDDLLVHEGAGLLPAGLQHRLAARGVPAVPGGVLGDRLGDGRGDEAVVELGALASCRPRSRRSSATNPCSGSDGSSRRSPRDTADRSRTASPARRSSAGARPSALVLSPQSSRWSPRIQRSPVRDAGLRGGSGMTTGGAPGASGASPPPTSKASSWSSSASEKPTSDRSKSSAASSCSSPASSASSHGELGQPVVRDPVGPPLRLGQVAEHDHRRLGQPELLGGQHPAVAGDQLAVVRHEAGHRPAELRHGARDLRDLVRPVRLGVPRIGLQPLERPLLDALRSEAQGHVGSSCRGAGWIPGVDSGAGFHWAAWTPSGSGGIHPRKGVRL